MKTLKKLLHWLRGNSIFYSAEQDHLLNTLNIPYRCTLAQIEEFEKSGIWFDMRKVIVYQMLGIRDQLAIAREHNDVIHLQGELYRCGVMLDLLTLLKQALSQEESNG